MTKKEKGKAAGALISYLFTKTDPAKTSHSEVTDTFYKEIANRIVFSDPSFELKDISGLTGEPDEISITVMHEADGSEIIYAIYFSSQKLLVVSGDRTSHHPDDHMNSLWINEKFDTASLPPSRGLIQPWLGYRHFKEYLPGIELPAPIQIPTPKDILVVIFG